MAKTKTQSMAKGFTILGAAGLINKVLGIVYVSFLTRIFEMMGKGYGNVGNGIYNAGYQIYLFVFVITNQGIPVAISKMVSEQTELGRYEDAYSTFKVSSMLLIALGIVTTLFTAFASGWLANLINRPTAAWTVLALAPTMLFTAIASAYRGYFQGRANMTPTGVSQVLEQLINSILTIAFAFVMLRFGQNYVASRGITDPETAKLIPLQFAAAGGTVGTTVGAMVSALYLAVTFNRFKRTLRDEIRNEKRLRRQETTSRRAINRKTSLKKLGLQVGKYALPITLGAALVYAANLIDLGFINQRLATAGFDESAATSLYGIFSTQYQKIINIPLSLVSALAAALLPRISAVAAKGAKRELEGRVNSAFRVVFFIAIPAAVAMGVLARPIIWVLFWRNIAGMELLQVGAGVVVLMGMVQVQTATLQGIGKMHIPIRNMAIGLAVKIVVNYILVAVPSINVMGAVFGSWACYLITVTLNWISIRRATKVRVNLRANFVFPLVASGMAGSLAWILYNSLLKLLTKLVVDPYIKNLGSVVFVFAVAAFVYLAAMYYLHGKPKGLKKLVFGDG